MKMDGGYRCSECSVTFKYSNNLRRHALGVHPELANKIAPLKKSLKTFAFKCQECHRQYSKERNLKYHYKTKHDVFSSPKAKEVKCALCQKNVIKKSFEAHLNDLHDIRLNKENLEFTSYNTCYEWIRAFEQDSSVKYVKNSGVIRNAKGVHTVTFFCHRSGYYKPSGHGLRKMKIQGTKKLNAYCPSKIHVTIDSDGRCKVTYIKTHIGHQNELYHLTLTKTQRDYLAGKIAANVPFEKIIHEVQNSSNKFKRINLLTKHDLFNIKRAYNLGNSDSLNRKVASLPDYKKYEGIPSFEILRADGDSDSNETLSFELNKNMDINNAGCVDDAVPDILLIVKSDVESSDDTSVDNCEEKILLQVVDTLNVTAIHEEVDLKENILQLTGSS